MRRPSNPLEFKRDFDFRPARVHRDRKNRGFANIAGAQVQHDGDIQAGHVAGHFWRSKVRARHLRLAP